MTNYDREKIFLFSEQEKSLSKNDFAGVVETFNQIDTNIDLNCPNHRVDSERAKLIEKTRQWNAFMPTFRFNHKLDKTNIKLLSVGTENQCVKLGEDFYNFSMSDQDKNRLLAGIPLVRNNELEKSSDGVYTWILFTDTEGEYQFVAKKALTIQELSTKHSDIITNVLDELSTIHFAGELLKKDEYVEINFLSGSYMAGLFESVEPLEVPKIHNEAIEFLNERIGLTFTDQREVKTLITRNNIVYTHDNIQLLLAYGAIIKRFDSKTLCNVYDNRIMAEMGAKITHERNVGIWKQYGKKYGDEEPKYTYNPDFKDYDINSMNVDSIDLG